MSAASLFRVRATLTVGGVPCLHTTYWDDVSLVGGTALATEALARVRAFWNSIASLPKSTTTISFDTQVVQLGINTGQPVGAFTGSAPAAVTFSGAADPLPPATQFLVKYSTGVFIGGRALVGHSYLPGFVETTNDTDGTPTAATITSVNTALGLLGTTIVSPINQVVWHRPGAINAPTGQAEPVTSRTAIDRWAVQKGRRS